MSRIPKHEFEKRSENAGRRHYDNSIIAIANGMTQEQADCVSSICKFRHDVHSINPMSWFNSGSSECQTLSRELHTEYSDGIRESAIDSGLLPPLSRTDWPEDWEWDEGICEEATRDEFIQNSVEKITQTKESINHQIETWLRQIDEKYHTKFTPTGAFRKL